MPKRKSDDDSISHILKKIKKLEKKLSKKKRRRSTSSSSSSDDQQLLEKPEDSIVHSYVENNEEVDLLGPSTSTNCPNAFMTLDEQEVQHELPLPISEGFSDQKENQSPALDKELLDILGEDPINQPVYGKDIQKDLSVRLEHLATTGLPKERRKELVDSNLPPANFKLIDAPALNPEIKAAITEATQKRDKALFIKQKQIRGAIASVSQAITCILSSESKDQIVLKHLMDTERILCDLQFNESLLRRNFILAGLKKELKDQIQTSKVDKLLFGEDLNDTLRAAKAISKTGDELKSVNTQAGSNKHKTLPVNNNLNWRAPAPYRRPTGPPRAKESPRFRQLQGQFFRPSRPNNPRNSR